ncbi:hypothetical protein E4T38_02887 [Aureobasidium subglaciale]|nr:hypothetical protein E4T38_02887 [Aureobasidium subglaciale]KAI5230500.1 hypothetical protein E4T41_02886 [Aureobasidium subglaciale]KAI5264982.1 hypothetical protein E4T46_02664 [Aureobasidium subglaciale]
MTDRVLWFFQERNLAEAKNTFESRRPRADSPPWLDSGDDDDDSAEWSYQTHYADGITPVRRRIQDKEIQKFKRTPLWVPSRETYEDEGWRAFRLPVFVRDSSPAPSPLPATKPGLRDAFRAPTIYVYKDIGFDRYRVEAIEKTKLPQYNKVDEEETVDQLSPHSQYILDTENGAIFDSDAEDDDHGTYSTDNEVSKTDGIETQHGSIMDHFEDTRGTIGGIHRGSSAAVGDAVQPDLSSNPTIQFFQNSIKSSGKASNVDLFFRRPAKPTQVHDSGTHHNMDNASIIDNSQQQAATVTQDVREEPTPLHIRKRKQIASRSFATDRNVRPQINHYHGYETVAGDILPPTSTATVILQEYIEEIQYMLRHEIMSWPVNNHLRPLLIRLHADCGSCQKSKPIKQDLLPLLLRLKDYYRIVLDEGIEDMDRISADLDGPASMLSNPSLNVYRAIDGLAPLKYSNNALRAILARAEHCTQCMLRLSFLERRVSELDFVTTSSVDEPLPQRRRQRQAPVQERPKKTSFLSETLVHLTRSLDDETADYEVISEDDTEDHMTSATANIIEIHNTSVPKRVVANISEAAHKLLYRQRVLIHDYEKFDVQTYNPRGRLDPGTKDLRDFVEVLRKDLASMEEALGELNDVKAGL